ncbi:MAG: hypothetical protein PHY25_05680 [Dehalococcoidales bacterium]|jgi:tetrahydromethanopterin S-methyltransferase subunit F|nr:hypothetical protein [Dehalococcoidales bacterium]
MEAPAIVAILGAVFTLFGIILVAWGYREEKGYVEDIARRPDAKKFIARFPPRMEAGGLKAGGFISLAVGAVLFVLALLLWLVL